MKPEEVFGKIIRKIRGQKGISQEELANIAGLDRTFISLIENGNRNPTLITILKLSRALKVKPSFLLMKYEEESFGD